jgi:hypothetical protein
MIIVQYSRFCKLRHQAGFCVKKIAAILSLIFASSLLLAGMAACKPRIRLPEDGSITGSAKWLVISSLYCQMKAEPASASLDKGILRKGTVLKIEESRFSTAENEQGTLWFKVQNAGQSGWVSIRDAHTYPTETQARNAARRME